MYKVDRFFTSSLATNYQICNFKLMKTHFVKINYNLPVGSQLKPSPENPVLHVQLYEPTVFSHVPLLWQP